MCGARTPLPGKTLAAIQLYVPPNVLHGFKNETNETAWYKSATEYDMINLANPS